MTIKPVTEYKIDAGVELTIRRPDGTTEVKVVTHWSSMDDRLFSRIREETRKAGRGECLSYRNLTEKRQLSLRDQRDDLASRLCDPGDMPFPGSREYREQVEIERALAAFDAAHPDVIAEIREERAARHAAAVERALNMAD